MHRGRSLIAGLLVFALVVILSPRFAIPTLALQMPAVGDAVAISNEEGTPIGSIIVSDVIDPFEEFNPDYPAEAGSRYVVAIVAFDADSGQRFDITPWTVVLQDDAGFLWNPASLVLPDDALIPVLSSQTLAPGSRISGLVGFVVPEDRTPARIFYQPESSRVIPLAELSGEPAPRLGEPVVIADSEGGLGTVTVSEVVDPFEDVDPTQAPPEGTRFVLVTLVYENAGNGRFFIEPYGLLLRDATGVLWSSTYVTRLQETEVIPDLASVQLAPGDRLTGAVVFAAPLGAPLTGVYASPVSGQFLQLAALDEGAAEGSIEPVTDTDGIAAVDESAGGECDALAGWLATTRERIAQAAEMSVEDATLEDQASLEAHVAGYASLAEAQRAEPAPAMAEAANKALAATFNAYSSSIVQILSADEPGKDPALELTEGMNTFNAAGDRVHAIEEELARLAAACGLS